MEEKCHVQSLTISHHSCRAFLPSAAREKGCKKVTLSGGAVQCKRKCPLPHPFALTAAASTRMLVPAQRPDPVPQQGAFLSPYRGALPAACWRKAQPQPGKVAHLPLSSRGKRVQSQKHRGSLRALSPTQRPQGAPEPFDGASFCWGD